MDEAVFRESGDVAAPAAAEEEDANDDMHDNTAAAGAASSSNVDSTTIPPPAGPGRPTAARLREQIVKPVASFRGGDEYGPAFGLGDSWTQDIVPDIQRHERRLVDDQPRLRLPLGRHQRLCLRTGAGGHTEGRDYTLLCPRHQIHFTPPRFSRLKDRLMMTWRA